MPTSQTTICVLSVSMFQEQREQVGVREHQERLVRPAHPVHKDHLVRPAHPELQGRLVRPAHLVLPVHLVQQEVREQADQQDHPVHLV